MNLLLIIVLIVFCACSTESTLVVPYNIPTVRMQSPETTNAKWNGEISSSFISSQNITLLETKQQLNSSNNVTELTVSTKPKVKKITNFALNGNLGLAKNLDFITFIPWGSAYRLGLKYQLVGSAENEFKEGYKLAIATYYGITRRDERTTPNGFRPFKAYNSKYFENAKAKLNQDLFELDAIFGYRANKTIIYYTSLYYEQVYNKLWFYRQNKNDQIFKSHYSSYGWLLGLKSFLDSDQSTYLQFETGYTEIHNHDFGKDEQLAYGLSYGLQF